MAHLPTNRTGLFTATLTFARIQDAVSVWEAPAILLAASDFPPAFAAEMRKYMHETDAKDVIPAAAAECWEMARRVTLDGAPKAFVPSLYIGVNGWSIHWNTWAGEANLRHEFAGDRRVTLVDIKASTMQKLNNLLFAALVLTQCYSEYGVEIMAGSQFWRLTPEKVENLTTDDVVRLVWQLVAAAANRRRRDRAQSRKVRARKETALDRVVDDTALADAAQGPVS